MDKIAQGERMPDLAFGSDGVGQAAGGSGGTVPDMTGPQDCWEPVYEDTSAT